MPSPVAASCQRWMQTHMCLYRHVGLSTAHAKTPELPHPLAPRAQDAMLFSLEGGPELGNVSIREERTGWNSLWVERCFGRGVLEEIGNSTVSCSGAWLAGWLAEPGYVMHQLAWRQWRKTALPLPMLSPDPAGGWLSVA